MLLKDEGKEGWGCSDCWSLQLGFVPVVFLLSKCYKFVLVK